MGFGTIIVERPPPLTTRDVMPLPGRPVYPFGTRRVPGGGNTYVGGLHGSYDYDGLGFSLKSIGKGTVGLFKKGGKAAFKGARRGIGAAISGTKDVIRGARDTIAPPSTQIVPVEKAPFLTPLRMLAIGVPLLGIVAFVAMKRKRKSNPSRRRRRSRRGRR